MRFAPYLLFAFLAVFLFLRPSLTYAQEEASEEVSNEFEVDDALDNAAEFDDALDVTEESNEEMTEEVSNDADEELYEEVDEEEDEETDEEADSEFEVDDATAAAPKAPLTDAEMLKYGSDPKNIKSMEEAHKHMDVFLKNLEQYDSHVAAAAGEAEINSVSADQTNAQFGFFKKAFKAIKKVAKVALPIAATVFTGGAGAGLLGGLGGSLGGIGSTVSGLLGKAGKVGGLVKGLISKAGSKLGPITNFVKKMGGGNIGKVLGKVAGGARKAADILKQLGINPSEKAENAILKLQQLSDTVNGGNQNQATPQENPDQGEGNSSELNDALDGAESEADLDSAVEPLMTALRRVHRSKKATRVHVSVNVD